MGARVLLVESDETLRNSIVRALRARGIGVDPCATPSEALSAVTMYKPVVPVVANVGAAPLTDPLDIRISLVHQVTGTVRWRECVGYMAAHGVTRFYEIGAGKVLTGLSKKNAPEATASAIGTPDDIAAAAAQIKG